MDANGLCSRLGDVETELRVIGDVLEAELRARQVGRRSHAGVGECADGRGGRRARARLRQRQAKADWAEQMSEVR